MATTLHFNPRAYSAYQERLLEPDAKILTGRSSRSGNSIFRTWEERIGFLKQFTKEEIEEFLTEEKSR